MSNFNTLDQSKRLRNVVERNATPSIRLLVAVTYYERVMTPNKMPDFRVADHVLRVEM